MKIILSLFLLIFVSGCTSTVVETSDLINKKFPQVKGEDLNKKEITIPDNYAGKPTVLLVGYLQKSQFDIDRWILGLLQADVPVQIVEVPTIAGMMPQAVQGFINGGMRSGIPKDDWASVVTVYKDADKIIKVLGNERPQSAHVVLLNKDSQIVWNSNIGYSASQILELKQIANNLK